MDNLSVCCWVFCSNFVYNLVHFLRVTIEKHVRFCFFIEIGLMQFQENPMLLMPQHNYCLGTRSIGFSWNCIRPISIEKQNCTCPLNWLSKILTIGCLQKCTQVQIVHILVPLQLERANYINLFVTTSELMGAISTSRTKFGWVEVSQKLASRVFFRKKSILTPMQHHLNKDIFTSRPILRTKEVI